MNKPGPKSKKFCKRKHNISIIGRDKWNHCKECKRIKQREFRLRNLEYYIKLLKKYYTEHKKELLEYWRQYDLKRRKQKRKYNKQYRKNHRKETNKYWNNKIATDILFRITSQLRSRIRTAIKRNYRAGSAVRDLGCTIKFFKKYIEKKFYGNMAWKNWGKVWQLDHIKALWKFDLTDRKQFKKAVNYKNMQPLTISDHKKKTAKERRERAKIK